MRSLKSGLLAIALTSLVGTLAIVGCSADGGSVGLTDVDPTRVVLEITAPPSRPQLAAGDRAADVVSRWLSARSAP